MTVMVAVPDSPEGRAALAAATTEAELLGTDLVAINLASPRWTPLRSRPAPR